VQPIINTQIYCFTVSSLGPNWSNFLFLNFLLLASALHVFKMYYKKIATTKPIEETHPASTSATDSTFAVAPSILSA
jgi:hypothetical protein